MGTLISSFVLGALFVKFNLVANPLMVGPILAGMLTVGYGGASACYYMAGRHY